MGPGEYGRSASVSPALPGDNGLAHCDWFGGTEKEPCCVSVILEEADLKNRLDGANGSAYALRMGERIKKITRRAAMKASLGVIGATAVVGSAFSWLLAACSDDSDGSGYGYGYGTLGYGMSLRRRVGASFIRKT